LHHQIELHLESCALCREEVQIWQKMAALPDDQPSQALSDRFYAMLERETKVPERSPWWHPAAWWPQRPAFQFALAASLLVVGWVAGRAPFAPASSGEVSELRSEVRSLRETMALALLQQSSAAERLKGVSYCATFEKPEAEVISALLRTLALDPNVDVRLASIDALRRYKNDAAVRRGLLDTLDKQSSPLVQIELIQALVEQRGKEAVPILKKVKDDAQAHELVRERAGWALEQLDKEKIY
jgi:hypothetical protein